MACAEKKRSSSYRTTQIAATIVLKGKLDQGGKARTIPIRTEAQRAVLGTERDSWPVKGSLIPSAKNYRQQLRLYEAETARAGLSRMHGLRHAYAQNRYEELTGWCSPAAGGPAVKTLAGTKRIDQQARLTISLELRHETTDCGCVLRDVNTATKTLRR